MSFLEFQSIQVLNILDSSPDPVFIYECKFPNAGDLSNVYLYYYIQGVPTTGRVRLNVFSNVYQTNPLMSSNWINLTELTFGTNTIGHVRFDFERLPISTDSTYRFQLETDGYTRNGNTFFFSYLGQQADSPNINLNNAVWFDQSKPAELRTFLRV